MKSITLSLILATFSLAVSAAPPAGHPSVDSAVAASRLPDARLTQQGTVLSVIDAPGYTYIEVKQGENTQWVAAQTVAVQKGDAIRFDDGAVMTDFYSKALDRTFPKVVFVGEVAASRLTEARLTQEGTVVRVIDVPPGYTYLEVKQGEKTQWIAAPTVAAEKGDAVRFDGGVAMTDFYSKALDRTFPSVVFVSKVAVSRRQP